MGKNKFTNIDTIKGDFSFDFGANKGTKAGSRSPKKGGKRIKNNGI